MRARTAHPVYMIAFSASISIVFTGAIMALHAATQGQVKRNERLLEDRALVDLFGLGEAEQLSGSEIRELVDRRIVKLATELTDPETGWSFRPILAFKVDAPADRSRGRDDLIGLAFPIEGVGFWAPIRGLMAVTPDVKTALGVVFVQHRETPGLGGRIIEAQWRRQFKGLDVTAPAAGGKFIYVGGPKQIGPTSPRAGRRVDAITGATQTSLAVDRFVNASLRRFRRVMDQRPDLLDRSN